MTKKKTTHPIESFFIILGCLSIGMLIGVLISVVFIIMQPTTPEWTEKWECVEWSEVCYCSVHDINCTNVVCPCIKQQLVRVRAND